VPESAHVWQPIDQKLFVFASKVGPYPGLKDTILERFTLEPELTVVAILSMDKNTRKPNKHAKFPTRIVSAGGSTTSKNKVCRT
jgi:hypothetical protein